MTVEPRPADHDGYRTWDGPYVLGALTSAERAEYERHLAECPDCQAAVAELAGLPGLLARVPLELVEPDLPDGPEPPSDLQDRLLRAAAGESNAHPVPAAVVPLRARTAEQRREWIFRAGIAAAAAAVAVAVAVPLAHNDSPAAAAQQVIAARTMEPVGGSSPITASFQVIADGTDRVRVTMVCRYGDGAGRMSYTGLYQMWVVGQGVQDKISEWPISPGGEVRAEGVAVMPPDRLRSVEIRAADTGDVLLRATV
ncbi:MAG: zf-HC2 domain-containing protein [Mycobacteriaceae bacterium]|nr:zf-HC2 domain-containing protein [Mycobacteriaceae bacterium]